MPMVDQDAIFFTPRIRSLQIIAGALILGVLAFAAVAVFLAPEFAGGQPDQALFHILLGVSVFLLLQAVVLGILLPPRLEHSAMSRIANGTWLPAKLSGSLPGVPAGYFDSDAGKLLGIYHSTTVIRLALFEGAAFTGIMTYLLSQNLLGLVVPGLAVGAMAALFPTATNAKQWLESRLEKLERMRSEASSPAL